MRREGLPAVLRQIIRRGVWILILRLAKKLSIALFRVSSYVLPHGYFSQRAVLKHDLRLLKLAVRHLPNHHHAVDELAVYAAESDDGVILGMILDTWELDDPDEAARAALKHGYIARFWQIHRRQAAEMQALKRYVTLAADCGQAAAFRELLAACRMRAAFSEAYWQRLQRVWETFRQPEMVEYVARQRLLYTPRAPRYPTHFGNGNGWGA